MEKTLYLLYETISNFLASKMTSAKLRTPTKLEEKCEEKPRNIIVKLVANNQENKQALNRVRSVEDFTRCTSASRTDHIQPKEEVENSPGTNKTFLTLLDSGVVTCTTYLTCYPLKKTFRLMIL